LEVGISLGVGARDLELLKTGCHFRPRNYLPRSRSAHLIPYLGIELASEVAQIDKWKQQLAERGASKRFEAE